VGAESISNQEQLDRFREAARQLERDDEEARFDAKLKKIATAKAAKNDEQKGQSDADGV
jgi:hypothetical protein